MTRQNFPHFLQHGAAEGVTGCCHRYIARDNLHLLVDCGFFREWRPGSAA